MLFSSLNKLVFPRCFGKTLKLHLRTSAITPHTMYERKVDQCVQKILLLENQRKFALFSNS